MQYIGGKFRIRKQIGAFFNKVIEEKSPEKYIEPFCGSCWVTGEITNKIPRIASDLHPDLILMWKELQRGWEPPEYVSEEEYNAIKREPPSALRGFIGFGCSFGGKFFGGFARTSPERVNVVYSRSARNSLLNKIINLKDVCFKNCSYLDIPIDITNRLLYLDPPYADTTGYSLGKFDSARFWDWVRIMSKNNHVYTSEYKAPDDFKAVLSISTQVELRNKENDREERIEKLFKYGN